MQVIITVLNVEKDQKFGFRPPHRENIVSELRKVAASEKQLAIDPKKIVVVLMGDAPGSDGPSDKTEGPVLVDVQLVLGDEDHWLAGMISNFANDFGTAAKSVLHWRDVQVIMRRVDATYANQKNIIMVEGRQNKPGNLL